MTAKARFLQKLQDTQPRTDAYASKGQADIAAFHRSLEAIRESIEGWLTDTGIGLSDSRIPLTEMLIGNAAFTVPCFELSFDRRVIKFTPLFLYGQGVTGCVEVSLIAGGQTSALCRLFMRSAESNAWTYTPASHPARPRAAFDEEAFFTVIAALLP